MKAALLQAPGRALLQRNSSTSLVLGASSRSASLQNARGSNPRGQEVNSPTTRLPSAQRFFGGSRDGFSCPHASRALLPATATSARKDMSNGRGLASGPQMSFSLPTPTVEPDWLVENLDKVKVLDASWYMPAEKRIPLQEFQARRLPGAKFFNVEKISDPTTDLPHMLPSEAAFSQAASALGLSSSDSIVVYDGKGIFSAARAWWMFRVFGHDSVAVLEGGLPLWESLGLPLETAPSEAAAAKHAKAEEALREGYKGDAAAQGQDLTFRAKLRPDMVLSMEQVLANIDSRGFQLVDARGAGRFQGTDPEPRPGLPSGSVPGSLNVPFPKVLSADGKLLCPVELEAAFHGAGVDLQGPTPLATSCGTGVTACILALALFRLGKKDVPVYDGSWTEWASTQGVPISSPQRV